MKFGLSKEGIHVGAVAYDALPVEEIFWRRRADSNRRIEVLQTSALDRLATSPKYTAEVVPRRRLELLQPFRPQRPQRCVSTNSTTSAV